TRRYQSFFDLNQLFVYREHLRVARVIGISFSHRLHGSDLYKACAENTCETPCVFARFEFFLRIDDDHARSCAIDRNGELSQFRPNLHLPESAHVEAAAPERNVRTTISE